MSDQLLRQLALVSESQSISPNDVALVSAALQKQASRDLIQFWDLKATVDPFPRLEDVPVGYWPIIIMDDIHEPGAAGVHKDENGQPFALVTASQDRDVWSLTCSHEMIEMLVDPSGDRLIASDSPKSDQGRVQILVEACDPSEAADFAYTVNGILVSDFYSVRFFDPVAAPGVRYSFTGAIQEPRQVLPGGYLSWVDPSTGSWWQETWFDGDGPSFRELGRLDAQDGSFRSQIDRRTTVDAQRAYKGGLRVAKAAGLSARKTTSDSHAHSSQLREQIRSLTNRSAGNGRSNGPDVRLEGLRRPPSVLGLH